MVAWWHIFKNLQGMIAIHTNGNKIVGHASTYKTIPNRYVGGMVANFPKLAGDSNAHKWQ